MRSARDEAERDSFLHLSRTTRDNTALLYTYRITYNG